MSKRFRAVADAFAEEVLSGRKVAGADIVNACRRYEEDKKREDLELRDHDPDLVINLIQTTLVHAQGEDIDGQPLLGKPLILQDWQVFAIFNLLGFYYRGTNERRYKEAFIMVARKNGKTTFIGALAWAVSILQRRSGSRCYIVAAALKQTLECFNFLCFSVRYHHLENDIHIKDNSFEHSISYEFKRGGTADGSLKIIAMPANPESQDSFNCNFAIADEIAAYRSPAQYNRFLEAMSAYTNRLMVGITTAGDNINTFGYRRMEYAAKVAAGEVKDDSLFSFIARADEIGGEVDYLDPIQHEKANLSYGVTIRPEEIMTAAQQAKNDPQQRKDFLSRRLNRYTASMKAWFDLDEFQSSDGRYTWTIDELAKLPVQWFGGADLSRTYDLTAAALVGVHDGVTIILTHAFFPAPQLVNKSEEDQIPVYEWLDEGWLTLCNAATVQAEDVVKWFSDMRARGFKIRQVGHDRKFAGDEYIPAMKKAHFSIIDQPQLYFLKSQGFRYIEKAAKDGRLYYCHSKAYEYCLSNVKAEEKVDDSVAYEKVGPNSRIDLFDASVFACVRMLSQKSREKKAASWFGETKNETQESV